MLHTCCAPCACHPVQMLCKDYDILAFFSNSNIAPEQEYKVRLESFYLLCGQRSLEYHVDEYDNAGWLDCVKGLEDEPERGARCAKCIYYRLKRSYDFAKKNNIMYITSTLTVAPYKDSPMIFEVADSLSGEYGIEYVRYNFKKNDGFKKTMEQAKKSNLYLQKYCGCIFSSNKGR
ncbi:MAG: epoxyqueuosine reductase QueH [Oligoflexia bacterium]|nr:epoxyqueuosine reductase QueH [Oligoflexia bacterium]